MACNDSVVEAPPDVVFSVLGDPRAYERWVVGNKHVRRFKQAAMAASSGPATVSGLTDPRRWGWRGWVEDLFPHLAYGVAATRAYASLAE